MSEYRHYRTTDGRLFSIRRGESVSFDGAPEEVQVVPLDAIVIDRADLPEVSFMGKTDAGPVPGTKRGADHWDTWISVENYLADPERLVRQARAYLALDAYFQQNPPVDEAQVKALMGFLAEDPEVGDYREIALRLIERGVRVEVGES